MAARAVLEDDGVDEVDGLDGDTDGGRACLRGSRDVLSDLLRDLNDPHSDQSPSPRP